MNKILTIIGPTASGKTSLSIKLAKRINAEIVGLDSRQIYKGMEIGTAQPNKIEMDGINHHLFGFRTPSKPISAGEYARMVNCKIKEIQDRNRRVIICGGAGLYYRALSKGIFNGSVSNIIIRNQLEEMYNKRVNYLSLLLELDETKTIPCDGDLDLSIRDIKNYIFDLSKKKRERQKMGLHIKRCVWKKNTNRI